MSKRFRLSPIQIRPLATGHGSCIASDHITVDGKRVGFMYRQAPERTDESGWVFFSGEESQAYLDDAANLELYDVNTIANYDPAIIPLLTAPVGTAYGRDREETDFHLTPMPSELDPPELQ